MSLLGAAAVKTGGSFLGKLLGGIGGLFFNKKKKAVTRFGNEALGFGLGTYGQNRGFKKAKEQAMFDFNLSKQMFDYQNAYNTPAMQMKRLREAGLNPALMYGQGTTGNAERMNNVGMQSTSFNPAEIAQTTAAGAQMSLVNANKELLEAQKRNVEQDSILKGIKGFTDMGHYKLKANLNPYERNVLKQQVANGIQDIEESKSRILVQDAERVLKGAQLNLTQAQTQEAIQRANKIVTEVKLNEEVIKEYGQGYSRNYAKILGTFFGLQNLKTATPLDKATTLFALTPYTAGGKLVGTITKGTANVLAAAFKWLKGKKLGFK